jgi:hypothetical protein
MFALPPPRFMPCVRCGASVETRLVDEHACDEERRLDYLLFQHRYELVRFESELAAWLESPDGRFELFYAARSRQCGVSGSMNG